MLRLYNTLTRKKEEFKPLKKKEVGLYTCGPTVYFYAHIGNFRTYIFEDLLRRTLEFNYYKVKHVMNITDVGHLTSNADTGEDKIEQEAKKEGKTAWDIAEYYTQAFQLDMRLLNIQPPTIWCKATEHIKEQIELIQQLEKKGYTYIIERDGVYFDTSKFKNYGKLAKLDIKGLKAGARIKLSKEKKNPTDFALWKFSPENQQRQMEWDSPFGKGFPGWHIECSAMAMKYLGKHFDIHCGGIDHIPVHHTNEIAQSEAATEETFANYWMHGAFLQLKDKRMGKSEGNILRVSELKEKGFEPLDYRYLCLTAHYRKPLEFSMEALQGAHNSYQKLKEHVIELQKGGDKGREATPYLEQFEEMINDDLNMPRALAVMWEMIHNKQVAPRSKKEALTKMDLVLGLNLGEILIQPISQLVQLLNSQREEARKKKDWKLADQLREQIEKAGYLIQDSEQGPIIKPKHL
ncbi:MAG TPA: cysteine--tRNA ligase [Candidatus Nanoarchaeia archaeon]|nr:cysteine--tRNA ligase [Candidatus Nanoarchaeia archaeon]